MPRLDAIWATTFSQRDFTRTANQRSKLLWGPIAMTVWASYRPFSPIGKFLSVGLAECLCGARTPQVRCHTEAGSEVPDYHRVSRPLSCAGATPSTIWNCQSRNSDNQRITWERRSGPSTAQKPKYFRHLAHGYRYYPAYRSRVAGPSAFHPFGRPPASCHC